MVVVIVAVVVEVVEVVLELSWLGNAYYKRGKDVPSSLG